MPTFIKNIIYQLKKEYGEIAYLYQPKDNTYNLETGESSLAWTQYKIRKAIVLPATTVETFTFTLAYIVAIKNFTYGANYNRTKLNLLFETKDLGSAKTSFDKTWKVKVNGEEYNIEEIESYEKNSVYLAKCLRTGADAKD